MAAGSLTGFSTAFDEMLQKDRDDFDKRLSSAFPETGTSGFEGLLGGPATRASVPKPPAAPGTDSATVAADKPISAARAFLDGRFGGDWVYEVLERRIEDGEAIALLRLSVPSQNISKTQFGRASLRPVAEAGKLTGSVDGVPFSMRPAASANLGGAMGGDGAPAPAARRERSQEEAYRDAIDDALAKCADLF